MRSLLYVLSLLSLGSDWKQWRGPNLDGTSSERNAPLTWSATENVRWKVPLTGAGNSSPIVWKDRVFLTSSDGRDHSRLWVTAFDLVTGKRLWNTRLFGHPSPAPFSMFPPERGHAAPTPATDGKHFVALFGTGDLMCLDLDGNPLWMRSLGKEFRPFRNDYGIAASPLIVEDLVLVQIDHGDGSYLLGVEVSTGKTRWKTDRPVYDNWSTPVVADLDKGKLVICLGTHTIKGYELATGVELWSLEGVERLCSTTPIVRGNRLYVTSGPNGANLAFDLTTKPAPRLLWESRKTGPFIPSAIVVGQLYFVCDDQGTLRCLDADSGEEKWSRRLNTGRQRPSPVAVGDRIYFTALNGTTVVIRAAGEFEQLARNTLEEEVAASPAVAAGCILFRTERHLTCIGTEK